MNLLKSTLLIFFFFCIHSICVEAQCVASAIYTTNGATCNFTSILHSSFTNPTYTWHMFDALDGSHTILSGTNPSHTFSGIPQSGSGLSHNIELHVTDGITGCQHIYYEQIDLSRGNKTLWFTYEEGSGINSGNMVLAPHSTAYPAGSTYLWKFHYTVNGNATEVYTEDVNPTINLRGGINFVELIVVDPTGNSLDRYFGEVYVPAGIGNSCLQNKYLLEITLGAKNPTGLIKGEVRDPNNVAIADFSFQSCFYAEPTVKRYFCLPDGCYTIYIEEEEAPNANIYSGTSYRFKNINTNTLITSGSRSNELDPLMIDTTSFCANYVGTNCQGSIDFAQISGTGGITFVQPILSGFTPNRQYAWTFDNGAFSTDLTPGVSLTNGWHQVCLTVTDANCAVTHCDSIYVNHTLSTCAQNPLTLFIDLDNYAEETYWEITDVTGTVVESDVYTAANDNTIILHDLCLPNGCYHLTVYDRHGDGICCQYGDGNYALVDHTLGNIIAEDGLFGHFETTYFCLGGTNTPCGAFNAGYFTHEVDTNGVVLFTTENPSNAYPLNFSWDFGNGNTSTVANPTFTFTENGYYEVCLTADSMGCTFTYCDTVMVTSNSGMVTGPCPNLNVNLTINQDPNNPFLLTMQPVINNAQANAQFQFVWDFGDVTTPLSGLPSHNYKNYGSYVVCLLAIDTINGCTATFCDTITLDSMGNFSRNFVKVGFSVNTITPIVYTGVETIDETSMNIHIYPNPVHDFMNIRINNELLIVEELAIIDVTGRVIQHQFLELNSEREIIKLSINDIPAGIYFLKIKNNKTYKVLKFIKD